MTSVKTMCNVLRMKDIQKNKHRLLHYAMLLVVVLMFSGCAVTRVNTDIDEILDVYRAEVQKLKDEEKVKNSVGRTENEVVVESFNPWWHASLEGAIFEGKQQSASLDDIYVETLMHSSQIRVFSDLPLIRRTGIQEAKGEFDTRLFVEGRYDQKDDPVGSTLQTGLNVPGEQGRFREEKHSLRTGLRKKVITGGEFEAVQELSRTKNNSSFFTPNPQGNAELRLRYTQPLLKGAGIHYNESTIKIAEIDSEIAVREFLRQTESHLVEVARAYWGLYMARAVYLQKKNLVDETDLVVSELQDRQDLDAESAQLSRARAAYANRRADLVRSELAIRNAQDRIQALVNSAELYRSNNGEFIPLDAPTLSTAEVSLTEAAAEALENRPEIAQAFKQLKAAALREDMARNEILPTLNVFVEGYLGGLENEGSYTEAWDNQFDVGAPGHSWGFYAEYPLENQIGRARLERRKLETRQQLNSVKTTIETVLLELKVSVREVNTAMRDVQAKLESMRAAEEELRQLKDRRGLEVGDELTASSFLSFLLDSQERQAVAEDEFTRSLVTYNVSLVNLERAKGTLLTYEDITYEEYKDDELGLPTLRLQKHSKGQEDPNAVPLGIRQTSAPQEPVVVAEDLDSSVDVPELEIDSGVTTEAKNELLSELPEVVDEEASLDAAALKPWEEGYQEPNPVVEEEPLSQMKVEEIVEEEAAENLAAPVTVAAPEPVTQPVATAQSESVQPKRQSLAFPLIAGLFIITGIVLGVKKLKN